MLCELIRRLHLIPQPQRLFPLFLNQKHNSYTSRSQLELGQFCSSPPVLPAQYLLCFQTPLQVPLKRAARSRGREAPPDVDPGDQEHTLSEGTGSQDQASEKTGEKTYILFFF